MDALATFGSLIITDGSSAATMITASPGSETPPVQVQAGLTPEELQAADTVFATDVADPEKSPAFALMVATACASTLKGVVLDEGARSEREDEEEEEPPRGKTQPNIK